MKAIGKLKGFFNELSLKLAAFMLAHRKPYMALTATVGAVAIVLLAVQGAHADLKDDVGDALTPLAQLLVGPIAKGLSIIAVFAFVALLIAGRFLLAVSTLVGAVILGLMAMLVNAFFNSDNDRSGFTLH